MQELSLFRRTVEEQHLDLSSEIRTRDTVQKEVDTVIHIENGSGDS